MPVGIGLDVRNKHENYENKSRRRREAYIHIRAEDCIEVAGEDASNSFGKFNSIKYAPNIAAG